MPLSEKSETREAEQDHVVKAPVRARFVVPVQFLPNLIAAYAAGLTLCASSPRPTRIVGWSKGAGPFT